MSAKVKKYLFKRASDGAWIFGLSNKSICPSGAHRVDFDGLKVTIYAVFNRDSSTDDGYLFSDYLKENNEPYESLAAFQLATVGFFDSDPEEINGIATSAKQDILKAAIDLLATAVNQTNGNQKTQVVDPAGNQLNVGVCNGCIAAALSDSVDLTHPGYIQPRTLAGNIHVTDVNGNESTLIFDKNEVSLFRVKRVWTTGTTAGMGIVVLY